MVYGIDEVGRGAWAGPLVMAGVSYDGQRKFGFDEIKKVWRLVEDSRVIICDSKKLSRKVRELSACWLEKNVYYRLVEDSAEKINEMGIRKVWDGLVIDLVSEIEGKIVIDGNWKPDGLENVQTLVKGDTLVWEISAASILAKVYRDNLMLKLAEDYKGYGWERNVGYGTKEHREAIVKLGTNDQHRKLWVRKLFSGKYER